MISDLDIWRAAQLIIKHHDDTEAPLNPDPFRAQHKGKPRSTR